MDELPKPIIVQQGTGVGPAERYVVAVNTAIGDK